MKRRLVTLAAGASLVMCIATVVLWIYSSLAGGRLEYRSANAAEHTYIGWLADCAAGQVSLMRVRSWVKIERDESSWHWQTEPVAPALSPWKRLGLRLPFFEHRKRDNPLGDGTAYRFWGLYVPCWMLSLCFLPVPTAWLLWRRRDAFRSAEQRCRKCGYDLRATPDRCPECGSTASASAGSGG